MQKKESRRLLDLPESAEIILNVGSEEKRKNIQTLLKAFFEIAKQREDAVLLRVGEQRQETTRLAKKLGIFEKIKYLNNLSRENLALAYNAADALAFCSYYEGFGLPVLEAMACGCPVVAASASSVPEIAGKAALLVENPLDAKAFSDCIERVLASRALAKSLERKGFARARGFSWKKNAEATIKVYEGVLR
jgi:glycosyltransferase involved in cell wall biosynthesis